MSAAFAGAAGMMASGPTEASFDIAPGATCGGLVGAAEIAQNILCALAFLSRLSPDRPLV
jgi:hypothetical protein